MNDSNEKEIRRGIQPQLQSTTCEVNNLNINCKEVKVKLMHATDH